MEGVCDCIMVMNGDVWRAEEGAIGEAKSDKGEWKEGEATEMWG